MRRSTQILLECLVAGIFLAVVLPYVPAFAYGLGGGPTAATKMATYKLENQVALAKEFVRLFTRAEALDGKNVELALKVGGGEPKKMTARMEKSLEYLRHCQDARTIDQGCVAFAKTAAEEAEAENLRLVEARDHAIEVQRAAAEGERARARRIADERERAAQAAHDEWERQARKMHDKLLKECAQYKGQPRYASPATCSTVMREIDEN